MEKLIFNNLSLQIYQMTFYQRKNINWFMLKFPLKKVYKILKNVKRENSKTSDISFDSFTSPSSINRRRSPNDPWKSASKYGVMVLMSLVLCSKELNAHWLVRRFWSSVRLKGSIRFDAPFIIGNLDAQCLLVQVRPQRPVLENESKNQYNEWWYPKFMNGVPISGRVCRSLNPS